MCSAVCVSAENLLTLLLVISESRNARTEIAENIGKTYITELSISQHATCDKPPFLLPFSSWTWVSRCQIVFLPVLVPGEKTWEQVASSAIFRAHINISYRIILYNSDTNIGCLIVCQGLVRSHGVTISLCSSTKIIVEFCWEMNVKNGENGPL